MLTTYPYLYSTARCWRRAPWGMTVLRPEAQAKRAAHTVRFPSDCGRELADMFDREMAPEEPTLYLCAQSLAHGRSGASRRPANSAPQLDGIFLASGSAHPGGGLPLRAPSGRRAAVEAASYLEQK